MSQITVENIKRSTETASRSTRGVAAAWVNFNGTGTVAIRDSQNISSLIDVGTGTYDVYFSSNMASSDYAVAQAASDTGYGAKLDLDGPTWQTALKSRQRSFQVYGGTYGALDCNMMDAVYMGDLA